MVFHQLLFTIGSKKQAPFFFFMQSDVNQNQSKLAVRIGFPALCVSFMYSAFWLAQCNVYGLRDWLEWLPWFWLYDTQLTTALYSARILCKRFVKEETCICYVREFCNIFTTHQIYKQLFIATILFCRVLILIRWALCACDTLNRSISVPGLSSFALLEREGRKMQDPGNGVVLEVLHSRQPCCMAGIMKMFCIRNNISSHRKKNLLFLPWNMAAEQNRYQASTANDQILVLSRTAARSQFRHRKLITLKQLINIFSLVLGVQICHGCISTLIHWILSFDGNSPINHPGCLHYQH